MDFVPPGLLRYVLQQVRARRIQDLRDLGYSRQHARTAADKESAEYDVLETDGRGWVRLDGLEHLDVRVTRRNTHS